LLAFFLLIPTAFGRSARTQADPIQVVNARVQYQFGQEIRFGATLLSGDPVRQAYLLFQPEGGETQVGQMLLSPDGQVTYRFNAQQQSIRPFSRIYYWFRITTPSDKEYTSPSFWFDYADNRFQWQSLSDPSFRVHWYKGSIDFGQMAQNIAQTSLEGVRKWMPLSNTAPFDIYIYASNADLQSALEIGGLSWVGGHASPDLGVVMVSEEPGPQQAINLERQIPHELTHILMYRSNPIGYAKLPTWLIEGLASLAELYPNSDYQRALDTAKVDQSLLPLDTLCGAFPQETTPAITAYAESASFTRYIEDRFGIPGLQTLMAQYQSGISCTEAVRIAFGIPFTQLETEWQQEALGMPVTTAAVSQQFIPYLLLMGIVLVMPVIAGGTWYRRKRQHEHRTKENAGP
jgi:hypothetical protein